MKDLLAEFETQLTARTNDKSKTGQAVINFLENHDDVTASGLLLHAMANFRTMPQGEEKNTFPGIDEETWEELVDKNGEKIMMGLAKIVSKDTDSSNKAAEVWQYIKTLPSRDEAIFALSILLYKMQPIILESERAGAITMSQEEYDQILDFNMLICVRFTCVRYSQMSLEKRASAILHLLKEIPDRKLRVVALAATGFGEEPTIAQTIFTTFEFERLKEIDDATLAVLAKDQAVRRKMMSVAKITTSNQFDQHTERFGAVLNLIESETDSNKQVLMMATMLSGLDHRSPMAEVTIIGF